MTSSSRCSLRVASSVVAGLVLVCGLASTSAALVSGRAAQASVTITGKVKSIGATKAKGSCSFTGTRDGRPVSGSCTIVFTGKGQADGAWHTTSATLTYTGTGRLHRFTAEGTPTIRFPSAPSVDLGKFTFGAKGRGNSFIGGTDDGSSI